MSEVPLYRIENDPRFQMAQGLPRTPTPCIIIGARTTISIVLGVGFRRIRIMDTSHGDVVVTSADAPEDE